jgi:nicotinate-nucleotide pyrophosphorylase (carboxylating)
MPAAACPRADALIALALAEDAVKHDITSRAVFPRGHRSRAVVDARQDLVVCGLGIAAAVFRRVDRRLRTRRLAQDGDLVRRGALVLEVTGPTAALLAAERTALNFLQRLSGIATQTRRCADAVRGTGVSVVDTRKTTPGWRALEKYAVRTGGGRNHRLSLRDLFLIKDNHIAAAGSLTAAVRRCRAAARGGIKVEVEAKSLGEVSEAVAAGADIILLDNMTPARIRAAVRLIAGRATVEVSGGVTPATLRRFALPGVDLISLGALTHSVAAADLSLDLRERLA